MCTFLYAIQQFFKVAIQNSSPTKTRPVACLILDAGCGTGECCGIFIEMNIRLEIVKFLLPNTFTLLLVQLIE